MRHRWSLILAICCVTACAEERPDIIIAADSPTFDRTVLVDSRTMAGVTFTITSRKAPAAFVPGCGAQPLAAVEQATADGWTQYDGGYCTGIHPETPIELHGGNRVLGNVLIADPGRYRLRLDFAATSDFEHTYTALSDPFEVR